MIYLDNASTTPIRKEVLQVMLPYYSKQFGNPSSIHQLGLNAKEAVENSRTKIATILNAKTEEIIFTSGGTESVNLAIQGVIIACKSKNKHIITSKIEHPSVLQTCKFVETLGVKVTYVSVNKDGLVNPRDIEKAITKNTILISIMYANNEIGTIQPIKEIAQTIQEHNKKNATNILFHSDACQAGLLPLNVTKLGVNLLTLNSSKMYGPKGIGLLYVKEGTKIKPLMYGGNQEFEMRGGTENVPGIIGFVKAFELIQQEKEKENKKLRALRDLFITKIQKKILYCRLNGNKTKRLSNNVNILIPDMEAEQIVKHLSIERIYISAGSACKANSIEPSHVLLAIGLSEKEANSSIRISIGKDTTKKDIGTFLKKFTIIVSSLKKNVY